MPLKVKVGDRLRLHTPHGRKRVVTVDNVDRIEWDDSEDAGHLPADSIGTVVAIVSGGTTGVGEADGDHAVIQFGPAEHAAPGQRHWSYPVDELDKAFESAPATTKHRYGAFVKEVK